MLIYVSNLNFRLTEDDLQQIFEGYGQVETVKIPRDRETNRPRGFAFVEMPSDEEGQAAVDGLNGAEVLERELNVKAIPADLTPASIDDLTAEELMKIIRALV